MKKLTKMLTSRRNELQFEMPDGHNPQLLHKI